MSEKRKIHFVFKNENFIIEKIVSYTNEATDEEVQRDYDDWIDSINKGYWEEV